MKKVQFYVLSITMTMCSVIAQAQQPQPNPDVQTDEGPIKVMTERPKAAEAKPLTGIDRLRLGGSFGLNLGTITNINVSPMVGVQINERLTSGVGVTYQYISARYLNYSTNQFYRESTSNYGGRMFAFYHLFSGINANAELETLSTEYNHYSGSTATTRRTWLNSAMVGGSYSQPLGGRFTRSVNITVLYNLSYNSHLNPTNGYENIYPTSSPLIFRVTFF